MGRERKAIHSLAGGGGGRGSAGKRKRVLPWPRGEKTKRGRTGLEGKRKRGSGLVNKVAKEVQALLTISRRRYKFPDGNQGKTLK